MPNPIPVTLTKGNEIKSFPSMKEAERFLGIHFGGGAHARYYLKIQRPLRGYKITKQAEQL